MCSSSTSAMRRSTPRNRPTSSWRGRARSTGRSSRRRSGRMNEPQAVLSLDQMLMGNDTEYDLIDVPEWGGQVRIGSLTAEQMVKWTEAKTETLLDRRNAGLLLLVSSIVDADGHRIANASHVAAFRGRSAKVLNRIIDRILKMNGLIVSEEVHQVDPRAIEARKNGSGEAQPDASLTA